MPERGEDLHTDLRDAAIEGDVERATELMKQGGDVNHKNQVSSNAQRLIMLSMDFWMG